MQKTKNEVLATVSETNATQSCTAVNSNMAPVENRVTVNGEVSWKRPDGTWDENSVAFSREFPAQLGALSSGVAMVGDVTLDVAAAVMMLQYTDGEPADISIDFNVDGKESVIASIPYPKEIFMDEGYLYKEESLFDEIRECIRDSVQSEVVHALAYAVLLAIEG